MIGRRGQQHGFTVLETLIFLAVASALFISSIVLVTDNQNRSEFTFGIQDLASELRDVVNDVSTGFYSTSDGLQCRRHPSGIVHFSGPAQARGSNSECIYVGRVVLFAPDGLAPPLNREQAYRVFTIVGLRTKTVGSDVYEVEAIDESKPRILPGQSQDKLNPYGIEIVDATASDGSTAYGFGYFTNFAKYSEDTVLEASPRNVNFVPFKVGAGSGESDIQAILDSLDDAAVTQNDSVAYCFEFKSYRSIITMGGNSNDLGSEAVVEKASC